MASSKENDPLRGQAKPATTQKRTKHMFEAVQFKREERTYSVAEFYDNFHDKLPQLVMVTEDFTQNDICRISFTKGQVLYLTAIAKQKRVVAMLTSANRDILLSIPESYSEKFCMVEPRSSDTEKYLFEILRKFRTPFTIRFPKNKTLEMGNDSVKTNDIPPLQLAETFEEINLLGHFVNNAYRSKSGEAKIVVEEFSPEIVCIPVFLDKIRFSLVTGILHRSKKKLWSDFQEDLKRMRANFQYPSRYGDVNIAEYPLYVTLSPKNYSYVQPKDYVNIVTLVLNLARHSMTFDLSAVDLSEDLYEDIDESTKTNSTISKFSLPHSFAVEDVNQQTLSIEECDEMNEHYHVISTNSDEANDEMSEHYDVIPTNDDEADVIYDTPHVQASANEIQCGRKSKTLQLNSTVLKEEVANSNFRHNSVSNNSTKKGSPCSIVSLEISSEKGVKHVKWNEPLTASGEKIKTLHETCEDDLYLIEKQIAIVQAKDSVICASIPNEKLVSSTEFEKASPKTVENRKKLFEKTKNSKPGICCTSTTEVKKLKDIDKCYLHGKQAAVVSDRATDVCEDNTCEKQVFLGEGCSDMTSGVQVLGEGYMDMACGVQRLDEGYIDMTSGHQVGVQMALESEPYEEMDFQCRSSALYLNNLPRSVIKPMVFRQPNPQETNSEPVLKSQPTTKVKILGEHEEKSLALSNSVAYFTSKDVARLTVKEVGEYLEKLNLGAYVKTFRDNRVDGSLLIDLDTDILRSEFGLTMIEAIRLYKFATEGHIPS